MHTKNGKQKQTNKQKAQVSVYLVLSDLEVAVHSWLTAQGSSAPSPSHSHTMHMSSHQLCQAPRVQPEALFRSPTQPSSIQQHVD